MDIKAMVKAVGISENELVGLTLKDQIKLITKKMKDSEKELEIQAAKTYISNYEKLLPKVKELLKDSLEVYAKSVGQRKSPTSVKIVGYNNELDEYVVFHGNKNHSIKDSDLIKSTEELMDILNTKKPKGKKKT